MFAAIDREVEHVSLQWSEEEPFGDAAVYKHFVPTGRGKV